VFNCEQTLDLQASAVDLYYATTFTRDVKYDVEKTGLGWKTDCIVPADDFTLPTNCSMKRPAS